MKANVNNNKVSGNANVQSSNEVNNQFAFERFCEFCKQGYLIQVQLKSKKIDNASFHISVIKENDEREEIRLFLNQGILDLVMNYLESGKLGDVSRINPNDLESFNQRGVEFKTELFKAERAKGKEAVWSYVLLGKLVSINYNHGAITFHPYPYSSKESYSVNKPTKKTEKRTYPIVQSWILEDSFSQTIKRDKEVINPNFSCNYSPQPLSPFYTFAPTKQEEILLINKNSINKYIFLR